MINGYVNLEIENGICTIEFYHPKSNSLPSHLLGQLAETIAEAGENDKVKVITLQSEGNKAFCAGASFDELMSIEDENEGKQFFSGFANVINAVRKCPRSLISLQLQECRLFLQQELPWVFNI